MPPDSSSTPSMLTPSDPKDPASGVFYYPSPDAPYPPPWYRSQTNEPGRPRAGAKIVDGPTVPYLRDIIHERGYSNDIDFVQRRDVAWFDFLLVTQCARGPFLNIGPAGIEEVLQDDSKDTLKPGEQKERTREVTLRELGR